MLRRVSFVVASLCVALVLAAAARASVFRGPGYYVVVASSYVVTGASATGSQLMSYYGPVEGPFADAATCESRRKATESAFKANRKSVLDGNAFFMCNRLTEPMQDDSGEWWKPQRGD